MTRILFAAAASLALMMAVSTTPSLAKKVSNDRAAHLLSVCMLDGGRITEPQGNGSYLKCCTKAGGYCIICKQDGTGLCNKTAYSSRPATRLQDEASAPGTVAPAKASSRRPAAQGSRKLLRK